MPVRLRSFIPLFLAPALHLGVSLGASAALELGPSPFRMRLRSVAVDFPANSDSRLEAPGAAGKVRLVLSTLQRVAPVRRVWRITCRVADRLMHSGNCVTCDFVPHQCQARQDNVLLEAFPRDVLCFALGIIGPLRCSCPPVCRGRRESAVPHFMVKRRLRRSALQTRLAQLALQTSHSYFRRESFSLGRPRSSDAVASRVPKTSLALACDLVCWSPSAELVQKLPELLRR